MEEVKYPHILREGDEAVWESMQGDIPVTVGKIKGLTGPAGRQKVAITLLAPTPTMEVGDVLEVAALWVRPQGCKSTDYRVVAR